ncbi:RND family transporter [Thermodesulfobacteriota bacterium]
MEIIARTYDRIVVRYPAAVLSILAVMLCFFLYHAGDFKLDASADSLMLEDDRDLQIFRSLTSRYHIQEFLVVTFRPYEDLFSDAALGHLRSLCDELRALERVDSVMSLLEIPLLETAGLSLADITPEAIKTLEDPAIDRVRAKQEILNSPIYRNLLLGHDGQTTGMSVNLKTDPLFSALVSRRQEFVAEKRSGALSAEQHVQDRQVQRKYEQASARFNAERHQDIETIRSIIRRYAPYGVIYLGGVPMIADDMITFIKNDLVVFGIGVFIFIVATLTLIFKEVRWVVLPLLSCCFAVLLMIGMLGFLNWKVTVISSNFISLLLILTMSMNIHLAVRYRQLCRDNPHASQQDVVRMTVGKMVWPCLYTALTTILAFCSLVFSGIRPVIDFGWMMTIGLSVTFITSFILFPAVLLLLKKSPAAQNDTNQSAFTDWLAHCAQAHGGKVILISILLAVVSMAGMTRLKVENSFIKYFRQDTEIYQGLKLIDDKLGGTMLLDVLLHFDGDNRNEQESQADTDEAGEDFGDEDEFDWVDEYDPRDYWFTPYKVERIKQVHDYLEGLPEVGKVQSLASALRTIERLNDGKEFDGIELGVLQKKIPDSIRSDIIDPYVSIEANEARIGLRVLDSLETLRRNELLQKIQHDLQDVCGLKASEFTLAGFMVLYNNMLQSLFKSQIMTLGIVMLGIGIMLFVLFRSLPLAIIGIIPNMLAVAVVLGIMGLLDIPLDMMTITIAAITMGIAIDNSIHYIYRFKEEFSRCGSYTETLSICHSNVGKAILNTSVTIIFGFSILLMSNFIPTIYFGIFTGLAMFIALLAVLTLMPRLILAWKPFH